MPCKTSTLFYLMRGCVGLLMLAGAFYAYSEYENIYIALGALVAAVIAFKGCPACWVLGLFTRAKK